MKYFLLFIVFFLTTIVQAQWTQIGPVGGAVNCLLVSGSNIFVGGWGVHVSTDNGQTWSEPSLDQESLLSLASNASFIFAGTYRGVYLSNNNGQSWNLTSLNDKFVYSLAVNGTNIFAGTYQKGV